MFRAPFELGATRIVPGSVFHLHRPSMVTVCSWGVIKLSRAAPGLAQKHGGLPVEGIFTGDYTTRRKKKMRNSTITSNLCGADGLSIDMCERTMKATLHICCVCCDGDVGGVRERRSHEQQVILRLSWCRLGSLDVLGFRTPAGSSPAAKAYRGYQQRAGHTIHGRDKAVPIQGACDCGVWWCRVLDLPRVTESVRVS